MVNTEDFIKRLEYLLDYYSLSASSFADKIRVQRSSISHLLSGRNKPSLDFILKIIDVFPDVNLYWMLNGKGNFLKSDITESTPTSPQIEIQPEVISTENDFQSSLFDSEMSAPEIEIQESKNTSQPISENFSNSSNSDIYKIVIFYKDGTFRDFNSKK